MVLFENVYAQDSLRQALKERFVQDSIKIYKPSRISFDVIFDNRKSYLRDKEVDIVGYNIGLIFRNRYRLGVGAYQIKEDQKVLVAGTTTKAQKPRTRYRELELSYLMVNFEYWLVNSRWLEVAIPVEVGFGNTSFVIKAGDNQTVVSSKSGSFFPSGIGLQVKIKPLRWVGLNGLIGYRKSLKTYDINADFDGAFYSYGVSVFIGNILDDIKFHKVRKRYRAAIAAL
ncbi:MAG: hypothetical protein K2U26_09070 [Cyclobacteriaceae bacterium]|nr:hypothetical protein [Cyclobacteriaceae bacterium]